MDKINNIGLSRLLTSTYDFDGFTEQEVWSRIAQKINIIIEHFNYIDNKIDNEKEKNEIKFNYLLNEGLTKEVAKMMMEKIEDGSISDIINKTVFDNLNKKIDLIEKKLNNNQEIVDKFEEFLGKEISDVYNTFVYASFKKLGGIGDGVFDNKDVIEKAINYCIDNDIKYLMFEKGIYYTSKEFTTKGITLLGQGYEIPFMTWDYTRPNGTNHYEEYKKRCTGSIITTDKNISLIKDGLKAENIGFLGNRRATDQNCVTGKGGTNFLEIKNVGIKGFGGSAIYFPEGVINPTIEGRCSIEQNYIGIEFGINDGKYTGETNRITIVDSSFNRNEKNGIKGKIKGRHIIIKNNKFECIGEPSDTYRKKPTSINDLCYAIDLELYNTGGWTNGSLSLEDNYLEETYGFAKIIAKNPVNGINICNNEWYPYDQTNYSNFLCFSGYIGHLNIEPNNVYTSKDYVYFIDFNVRNFNSCLPVVNGKPNISELTVNGETILDLNIDGPSFVNYNATKYEVVKTFPSGFITSHQYDSSFAGGDYFPEGLGATYLFINYNLGKNFDFGIDGMDWNNKNSGYGIIVDGIFIGIISGYSGGSGCFNIRGNRSNLSIGNGSAKIIKMSGVTFLNGGGKKIKPVFDWDNTILPYGK